MKIIQRGAEAVLYLGKHQGERVLVKDRIPKGYRVKQLDDRIRSGRTKREERLLGRARRAGIRSPNVFEKEKFRILMEFIDGEKLKDFLNGYPKEKRIRVYELLGEAVAKLHSSGIVHGDLTTSNMIFKDGSLYLIDFGLGKFSLKIEDQAVDLYLFYEALKSAHFRVLDEAWENVLKVYKQNYSKSKEVLKRFEKIDMRRRYRSENAKEKS